MADSGRFVMVTWAAGGNVAPAAGLARVLRERGHEVRVLGPLVLQDRFAEAGCTFRPFVRAREPGPMDVDVFDDNLLGWTRYITGSRLADDVAEELVRQPVDVVVVDAFLSAAMAAAEQARLPIAALVHVLYAPSVEGPSATQWDPSRPLVEATRAHLGLAPLAPGSPLLRSVWERADLSLACTPEGFDYPLADRPATVRYVGPILGQAPDERSETLRPMVLISFSTTNMRQGPVLQRALDACASLDVDVVCTLGGIAADDLRVPGNATAHDWLPHRELLARASAVVTHAGLSTVMHALASGVPMVCLPMGRDQPLNAERVATLGLGCDLDPEAAVEEIRAAVVGVLSDTGCSRRARHMADVIAGYGNGSTAAGELESLL